MVLVMAELMMEAEKVDEVLKKGAECPSPVLKYGQQTG
jgi:hypothetical protein